MSDPTIRISSCRQDGRCPECGLLQAGAPWPLLGLCGCRVCPICLSAHLLALLTEALRQRDERRQREDELLKIIAEIRELAGGE